MNTTDFSGRYEELYKTLSDAIPGSMLLIDRDLRVLLANQNFLRKSHRSRSNTIGRRLEKVFPKIILDDVNIFNQIRQVFKIKQPILGERLSYRAPGIPIWICYYSIYPFWWNEKVENVMLLMEDMTERRQLELQLLQYHKLAAMGVMAGGIAHELRNPLAICSSSAQFLLEDDLPAGFQKECAGKIIAAIQRGSDIIESLMKFVNHSMNVEKVQLDLISVLKETLALITHQARIQKIKIKSRFPRDPLWICGITGSIQQVFLNLFLNAIEAMSNGGSLSVSVLGKKREVQVRIADTGHGILKAEIDKVFDPFYTTSAEGKGMGLGLSICYSIVKEHSGSIGVESVEGKGSVFTVILPASNNIDE
ncbi:MAG: ATP-binding protein [Proteobacteria bacterium]|nr:ATP-binding protein [Pseudomonadota bacterium]